MKSYILTVNDKRFLVHEIVDKESPRIICISYKSEDALKICDALNEVERVKTLRVKSGKNKSKNHGVK